MGKAIQLSIALEKVLINVGGDRWIAVDDAEGYPYIAGKFYRAKMFNDVAEAAKYLSIFKKDYPSASIYNIRTVTLHGTDETRYLLDQDRYEEELAALNKKYGRS